MHLDDESACPLLYILELQRFSVSALLALEFVLVGLALAL